MRAENCFFCFVTLYTGNTHECNSINKCFIACSLIYDKRISFRFVDGECGSSSGDSTGQLELSGGEQPDESSPTSIHETNNNSLLHEDLERRI